MKNTFILFVFIFLAVNIKAQRDTVFTNTEMIICNVKEITSDAVKFTYPEEDAINSIYRNTVQQITFKSGRVQFFTEATFYKTLNDVEDYEKVIISKDENKVKGLFEVGEVHSKAEGTFFSDLDNIKVRANKKFKIVAAMKGANIIYLTREDTNENQTKIDLVGVAFTNGLPNYDDFINLFGNKKEFISFQRISLGYDNADKKTEKDSSKVTIKNIYNDNGFIMIEAEITGVKFNLFRVVYFDKETFTLMFEKNENIYNLKIR